MAVRIRAVLLGSAAAHRTQGPGAQERREETGRWQADAAGSETRQQGRHSAELTRQLSTARRLVSSRVVDMWKRVGGFTALALIEYQMMRRVSVM